MPAAAPRPPERVIHALRGFLFTYVRIYLHPVPVVSQCFTGCGVSFHPFTRARVRFGTFPAGRVSVFVGG